jgi:nucleotide-binding universal stress UspA family protein
MGRPALSAASGARDDPFIRTRDTTMTAIDVRTPEGAIGESQGGRLRLQHVLLATDLGDASRRATEKAITLAARDHAILQILAVARSRGEREETERRLSLLLRRARACGVTATAVVWHGDPGEAILDAAWTERPDVLILGARHHRWLARLAGSVSERIADEAPCRVEIVPS